MDTHQIHAWDLRAHGGGLCATVTDEKGIIDCLVFDGGNTVIYNTADEVKFIGILIRRVRRGGGGGGERREERGERREEREERREERGERKRGRGREGERWERRGREERGEERERGEVGEGSFDLRFFCGSFT